MLQFLTTIGDIFCVNCGNKLPSFNTANYCPNCGHLVKNENRILKYTSDGKPVYRDQEQENISAKITEIQSKGSDDGTSKSKEISRPLNASSKVTKQKQPISAIFYIVMFIFWVSLAIYFAYQIYGQVILGPAEDRYYESYGCYISDGGSQYTCPNGLPPPRK